MAAATEDPIVIDSEGKFVLFTF